MLQGYSVSSDIRFSRDVHLFVKQLVRNTEYLFMYETTINE